MAIYELKCAAGHRHEVIQSFHAPLPACPECGAATAKVPSRFGIGGAATPPPPPEAMPQTWRGTYGGDREYVAELRRVAEARRRFEEAYPEHAGDRRPVLAHEGPYANAPLRAGAPAAGPTPGSGRTDAPGGGTAPSPGGGHAHAPGGGLTDGPGGGHAHGQASGGHGHGRAPARERPHRHGHPTADGP